MTTLLKTSSQIITTETQKGMRKTREEGVFGFRKNVVVNTSILV